MKKIKHAVLFIVKPVLAMLTEVLQRGEKAASAQSVIWHDQVSFGDDTKATVYVVNSDPPSVKAVLFYHGTELVFEKDHAEVLGTYYFSAPGGEYEVHVRSEPSGENLYCPVCGCATFKEVSIESTVKAGAKLLANGEATYEFPGMSTSQILKDRRTEYVCQECDATYKVTDLGLSSADSHDDPPDDFDYGELESALVDAFQSKGVSLIPLEDLRNATPGEIYLLYNNGCFTVGGLSEPAYIMPDGPYILITAGNKTGRAPDVKTAAEIAADLCLPDGVGALISKYGAWGEHPVYLREDWQAEIKDRATNRGYWEWVASAIEQVHDERNRLGDRLAGIGKLADGTEVELLKLNRGGRDEICARCQTPFQVAGESQCWVIADTNQEICPACAPKEVPHG